MTPVVRVDANDASRVYGQPNPVLHRPTRSAGRTRSSSVRRATPSTCPVSLTTPAAPNGSGVGAYAIVARRPGAPRLSAGGIPYRVVTTDGTLTVTPARLTITADDQIKPFGETLRFAGTEFTVDGLVNGRQGHLGPT